ncbi:hypothetical protein PSTG_09146 [Puccinia striiformis f. sp. tritici PST-78]|uniref:Uncharacterized protein n=1 Tax=Puccinia striiformis f. sp. tritici PST-78 TaxID=1165861 RepID=A0A0L0VE58_9BASI|nr:hypothetical protein PSTG_09146 [Puccinia striiformis f. sp. tritici PST-78]
MHHALLSVLFAFPLASVNARELQSSSRSFVIRGLEFPLSVQDSTKKSGAGLAPADNSTSTSLGADLAKTRTPTTVPVGANSTNTSTSTDAARPSVTAPVGLNTSTSLDAVNATKSLTNTTSPIQKVNNTDTVLNHNSTTPPPEVLAPSPFSTSLCGKNVTFSDRACWFAAKGLAEGGNSYAQCGTCVLGLFDADKKAAFKPPKPIAAGVLQEQAIKLLEQCKTGSTPKKVSKRDNKKSLSTGDGAANVQLLMGFNAKSKDCNGL